MAADTGGILPDVSGLSFQTPGDHALALVGTRLLVQEVPVGAANFLTVAPRGANEYIETVLRQVAVAGG